MYTNPCIYQKKIKEDFERVNKQFEQYKEQVIKYREEENDSTRICRKEND